MTKKEIEGIVPQNLTELQQQVKKLVEESDNMEAYDLLLNFYRLAHNTIRQQLPQDMHYLLSDLLWLHDDMNKCPDEFCEFSKEKVVKLLNLFIEHRCILFSMPIDDEDNDKDLDY